MHCPFHCRNMLSKASQTTVPVCEPEHWYVYSIVLKSLGQSMTFYGDLHIFRSSHNAYSG